MDLSTLVKMSNTYGSNPAYVLAGGGNTSVKDDTTLYVKGSGTQLATIKAEEFVEMSRARLNEIMKTDYPEDDVKRESLYLADVMAAVTDADKTKRPSVEALLHNLFAYTYVLHVHPTLVNGLTCGKGAKELSEQLLGKDVLWIDICKPGYTLARICYEKMNAYKEEYGKDVQVLLLQNHGIFVAANTVEEIGALFDGVISKLEKQVKRTADVSDAVTSEKEQAAEKLSRLLGHAVEVVPVAEADHFVKDKAAAAPLLKPFTPDHIVYCGPYPLFVEDIDRTVMIRVMQSLSGAWQMDFRNLPSLFLATAGRINEFFLGRMAVTLPSFSCSSKTSISTLSPTRGFCLSFLNIPFALHS